MLSQKFAFKIGGENRPKWMMGRHWDRFVEEIGAKPQFIAKIQGGMMSRIEAALPRVISEIRAIACQDDELEVIKKIQVYILDLSRK